ncbi:MAG: DUF5309 family protein [Nitrospiraceae bacterium]
MTVPTIAGQRATAATRGVQQESRVIDMHRDIFLLEPSAAPLTVMSAMINRRSVFNPEFKALEDERVPERDTLDGAVADGVTTTITVDNGGYWHPNVLWRNQQTDEVCRIVSKVGNDLTVERGWGGTTAAAMSDGDTISSLGGAAEEGALSEESITTKKTVQINFTQIQRWPFAVTNTLMESDLYGSKELPWQQKKGGIDQLVRIESSFFWGQAFEDLTGNEPRRSTGGLDPFIVTNDTDLGGTFDMISFYGVSEKTFRYGAKDKLFFASRGIVANISADAHAQLELMPKDKTLGMDITRLVTPHGRLRIMSHDLFDGAIYRGHAYAVDPANVGYRFMRNRDNRLVTNIQVNDRDGRKDEFRGEVGFFRVQERTHHRFTNGVT